MKDSLEYAAVLPAGKYVIADPCYLIADPDYGRILGETDFFGWGKNAFNGMIVWKDSRTGLMFSVLSTAYGDGTYFDNRGNSYPVDAGCIGCIPEEMANNPNEWYDFNRVKFDSPVQVRLCGGKLQFGHIIIDTDEKNCDDTDG